MAEAKERLHGARVDRLGELGERLEIETVGLRDDLEALPVGVLVGGEQEVVGFAMGAARHVDRLHLEHVAREREAGEQVFDRRDGGGHEGHLAGMSLELLDRHAQRFDRRDVFHLGAPAQAVLLHAVLVEPLVREAALVTHPALVDLLVLTRPEAVRVLAHEVGVDRAAPRAARADRGRSREKPRTRAETEVGVEQRADRADVDDVSRVVRVELAVRGRDVDHLVRAAAEDAQLRRLGDFFHEAHAAGAEHAALLVEHHQVGELLALVAQHLGALEPRGLEVVAHVVVLQLALTGLVADRAVDGVVEEQELHHHLLLSAHLLGVGLDHRAF